jgi:hypothetical protein
MEKVLKVYIGQTESGHIYGNLNGLEDNDGREFNSRLSSFDSKLGATQIGGIYEFEEEGKSVSFKKKPVVLGFWKNQDDKTKWRTIDRACQLSKQQLKENSAYNASNLLSPIRDAYKEASISQRALILAEVIRTITNSRPC